VVPIDVPTPLCKEVESHLYVDSDHAGEKFTRHSRTGVVIFLNMAPIVWFSKAASYGGIECLWGIFCPNEKWHRDCPLDPLQVVNDGCAPDHRMLCL
jgi:hypothetical protein